MAALISDRTVGGQICHREEKEEISQMLSNLRAYRQS